MAQPPAATDDEPYAVARRLHDVTHATRQTFAWIASDHGLSAPQARLILRLFEPTPMGELADHLACDKSNLTGIAARLIDRGFITATPGSDRRVKLLKLTARGQRLRDALERRVAEESPAMVLLSATERRTLVRLLDKLLKSD